MTSRLALAIVFTAVLSACSPLTPTSIPTTFAEPTPTPSLDALGAFEGDPCAVIKAPVSHYFGPLGATTAFARAGSSPTDANTCEATITRADGATWVFTGQVLQFPGAADADHYFEMVYTWDFGGSEADELGDAGLITVDPVGYTARVAARSGAWVIVLADLNAQRTGDEAADDIAINDSARAFIDLMRPIVQQLP